MFRWNSGILFLIIETKEKECEEKHGVEERFLKQSPVHTKGSLPDGKIVNKTATQEVEVIRSYLQPTSDLVEGLIQGSSMPKPIKMYETYYQLLGGIFVKKVTTHLDDQHVEVCWILQRTQNFEHSIGLRQLYGTETQIREEIWRIRGKKQENIWSSIFLPVATYLL